jgi:hypothetical protein
MWLDMEVENQEKEMSFEQFCEWLDMFNDTEELYKASIQLLPEGEVL